MVGKKCVLMQKAQAGEQQKMVKCGSSDLNVSTYYILLNCDFGKRLRNGIYTRNAFPAVFSAPIFRG